LNCSEFPNSCISLQFAFFKNVSDVLADGRLRFLKQFAQLSLAEPHSFFIKADIDFNVARRVLVYEYFAVHDALHDVGRETGFILSCFF
jgi:hypothetical protein